MRRQSSRPGWSWASAWALILLTAAACGAGTTSPSSSAGQTGPATVQLAVTTAEPLSRGAGWIAVGDATAEYRLYRTADAGASWQQIDLPPTSGLSYLYWTRFLGPDDAFVLLGPGKVPGVTPTTPPTLYSTTDGGATWRTISPPGPLATGFLAPLVDFLDPTHGWYVDMPQDASGRATLFRTSDGGAHWQTLVTVAGPGQTSHGLGYPAFAAGIAFVDRSTGWISSGRDLFVTHDGGQTWAHRALTWPPDTSGDARLQPPTFLDADSGVVVAVDYRSHEQYPNGNCFTTLWETNDGGATWTGPVQPAEPGGGPALFSFIDRGHRIMAPPGSATQPPGSLSRWSGGTWSELAATGIPAYASFLGLRFVDADTGWALISTDARGPSLVATADGGRTWRVIETPTPTVPMAPEMSGGK